jgi:hypothetical protein
MRKLTGKAKQEQERRRLNEAKARSAAAVAESWATVYAHRRGY